MTGLLMQFQTDNAWNKRLKHHSTGIEGKVFQVLQDEIDPLLSLASNEGNQ